MSDHRYIQLVGTYSKTRSESARECSHWNENEKIWRSDDEPINKIIFNWADVTSNRNRGSLVFKNWVVGSRKNEIKADRPARNYMRSKTIYYLAKIPQCPCHSTLIFQQIIHLLYAELIWQFHIMRFITKSECIHFLPWATCLDTDDQDWTCCNILFLTTVLMENYCTYV